MNNEVDETIGIGRVMLDALPFVEVVNLTDMYSGVTMLLLRVDALWQSKALAKRLLDDGSCYYQGVARPLHNITQKPTETELLLTLGRKT